jgi:hypothetical protein
MEYQKRSAIGNQGHGREDPSRAHGRPDDVGVRAGVAERSSAIGRGWVRVCSAIDLADGVTKKPAIPIRMEMAGPRGPRFVDVTTRGT